MDFVSELSQMMHSCLERRGCAEHLLSFRDPENLVELHRLIDCGSPFLPRDDLVAEEFGAYLKVLGKACADLLPFIGSLQTAPLEFVEQKPFYNTDSGHDEAFVRKR